MRLLLIALLSSSASSAQFNARGRRPPGKSASPAPPKRVTPSPTDAPSLEVRPPRDTKAEERQVLIARYQKVVLEKPGDQVAIMRLMDLVRERDGNLTTLASELEAIVAAAGTPALGAGLALAEIAQSSGDAVRAERAITEAVTTFPKRPEGYLAWARMARKSGDLESTRRHLEHALPLQTGLAQEETLGELWQLCLELSNLECAKSHHGRLARSARGNGFVAGELGRALLARGQHREALEELGRVARAAEGDRRALVPALRDLGRAQLASGDARAALQTLQRASRSSEAEPALRGEIDALRADAHRALGTQGEFLEELARNARTADQFALLARLYEELGQMEKAAQAYRRARDLAPRDIDLSLALVRVLELTLDLAGAEKELARLVRQAPGQIDLVLRYIDLLLASGQRSRALAEFDRAAITFESDAGASFLLLELAERLQESERARRIELQLAAKPGLDQRHLVELGSRAYRQGDGTKARAIWKRILSERDKTRGAVLYGETLLAHDDIKGGLDALEQAVEAAPSELAPKVALARGLLRAAALATGPAKKDYEKRALASWLMVLKDPKVDRAFDQSTRAEARRQVVRLLKRTGRLTVEVAALERAFSGPKPSIEAGLTLAEAQILLRNPSDAERTLKRLHELLPGDRDVLIRLERVQLDQGKSEAAVGTLERLLAVDPARAREILGKLADLAFDLHDDARAIAYAERGVGLDPTDAEALAKLGSLYERSGRSLDAETAYRKALAEDAQLHAVAIKLGRLLTKRGESVEALGLLLRSLRGARRTDDVNLLGKQALAAAVSSDLTKELEDQLRPLCISRPETPELRSLLLDVISQERVLLEDQVQRSDAHSARSARAALATLADRNLGPLLSILAGADIEEQEQVILLLAWGDTASASSALLEFAEGSAPEPLRIAAIDAATKRGPESAAPRLVAILRKKGPNPRGPLVLAVVRGLSTIAGSEARRGLLLALEAEDPAIRAEALLALSERSPPLPEANLIRILSTSLEGETARAAAALALGARPPSKAISSALATQLGQESALVQAAVLTALAAQAPDDRRFLEAASTALFGADQRLASASLRALVLADSGRTQGPERSPRDATDQARLRVEERLWLVMTKSSTPAERLRLLQHRRAELALALEVALKTSRMSAMQALRSMARSQGSAALAPLYVPDTGSSTPDLDRDARASLASIHLAVLPWITRHAEGSDRELSTLALGTLCPDQGSIPRETLQRALGGADDAKFEASAFALAECRYEVALPLLAEFLETDPAWPRKRRMVAVLEEMGLRHQPTDPTIVRLLTLLQTSENELVKSRALAARSALGLTEEQAE